jgi:hypothetical protein
LAGTEQPVDELLAALPEVGLRLNNLFQRTDGTWQANVRDAVNDTGAEFGLGPTPAAALVQALKKAGIEVDGI